MGRAEEVLRQIEREAAASYPIIIGPERGEILDEVVRKQKPSRVLEIGTLVGYSAIRMGRLLQPGARITCLEKDGLVAGVARKNIEKAGLTEMIEVLTGDARQTIPKLKGSYDMVFIDAEKPEYLEYLRLVEDKLRKGAAVVADNVQVHASRMRDYLDYVRESGRYSSSYHEGGGDALEVSIKR